MNPMEGAIEAVNKLAKKYDVFFSPPLTTLGFLLWP